MNVLVGIVFVGVSVDSFSSGGDGLNCFADQFSKKGLVMTIIKIKIIRISQNKKTNQSPRFMLKLGSGR